MWTIIAYIVKWSELFYDNPEIRPAGLIGALAEAENGRCPSTRTQHDLQSPTSAARPSQVAPFSAVPPVRISGEARNLPTREVWGFYCSTVTFFRSWIASRAFGRYKFTLPAPER
jgi:hypothetical protein